MLQQPSHLESPIIPKTAQLENKTAIHLLLELKIIIMEDYYYKEYL